MGDCSMSRIHSGVTRNSPLSEIAASSPDGLSTPGSSSSAAMRPGSAVPPGRPSASAEVTQSIRCFFVNASRQRVRRIASPAQAVNTGSSISSASARRHCSFDGRVRCRMGVRNANSSPSESSSISPSQTACVKSEISAGAHRLRSRLSSSCVRAAAESRSPSGG